MSEDSTQAGILDPEVDMAEAPPAPRFDELDLAPTVLEAVKAAGYEYPTPIQAQAIPELLKGRDVIGGSQTGTGKTAAFALPILTRLGKNGKLRALILEPTRELAQQVYDAFVKYNKGGDLKLALLYGGVRYGRQREQLDAGADIVIATPGRLIDHLQQKSLHLKDLEFLVLDEADRMLDMGFMPAVRKIIKQCPKKRQSLLFSATTPPEIERLSNWMLTDPVKVTIGTGTSAAETVSHFMYPVDDRQKFDLLAAILREIEFHSVIIFSRTKAGADIIAKWLKADGHGDPAVLHSDRSQRERDEALKDFKEGRREILVATDIVARGIDISNVSHVINYDIPENPEDYVHRIGRTGRMRNTGIAITLLTATGRDFLAAIERFIKQKVPRRQLEGFDYNWSPILDEAGVPQKKKRNRGYNSAVKHKFGRR